jgi:dienelactone hydrolase
MTSTSAARTDDADPSAAPKRHGGASVIVGFAPWIVYWILSGNTKISTAVLVALALSVLNNANQYRRDHALIALEAGTTVWFAVALVLSYTVSDEWLLRWMSPLSNGAFFAVMLTTALIKKPFTVQYAKQTTPPEIWDTPGFMYVNWALTWVWIAATGLMTVISMVPSLVDSNASLTSDDPLNIACYWVLPYGLLGLCVIFTARFPDWFGAAFDDADPAREPAPAAAIPVAGGADRSRDADLVLTVEPRVTLLDEVPTVRVVGAHPGDPVVVRTTTVDLAGHTWQAQATFTAGADGAVDTSSAAPDSGSYTGVDGAGLLWSMAFATPGATPDIFVPGWGPSGTMVEASSVGRSVSATLVRRALPAGASVREVDAPGVVGRLFLPAGDGPFPGVVLLGGSEGGIDSMSTDAALLAAHGRAALVVGLFGAEGLEPELTAVPLERIQAGAQWLAAQGAVSADQLGAIGISRGAEALLAAAAHLDLPFTGIIAVSPSSVIWPGMDESGSLPDTSAWTLAGAPLPFVPVDQTPIMADMARQALHARGRQHMSHPPVMHLTRSYGASLDEAGSDVLDRARIPVERIDGRILLIAGDDDQVWPSLRMATDLAAHRGEVGANDRVLSLAGCGHLVRLGILPTDISWTTGIALGGSASAIAVGQRQVTEAVLSWLP